MDHEGRSDVTLTDTTEGFHNRTAGTVLNVLCDVVLDSGWLGKPQVFPDDIQEVAEVL